MDKGSLSYGPPRDDAELRTYLDAALTALMSSPPTEPDAIEQVRRRWAVLGEARVVRRDGWVAGGVLGMPMGQWFGGRSVPCCAVTAVAVAPEHRSRGVASFLMQEHLRELYAARVPLAVLYPATQPLYRRVGYERAGSRIGWQIALRTLTPPRTELSTRTVTEADHPRIREIYAARARRSSGWFDRSQAYWAQRVFAVYRAKLMGCVFESQGEIEAYVLYWHREQPGPVHYDLSVRDHGATTPRGLAAIVSFLTSHRSIAEHATLYSSGVDPLLFALEEQDTRAVIQHFAWMLRLVDVPAALALRGYPAPINATLHLDVHDELLAGNHGRFVLRVRDGVGSVEPGGEGSLRTDVRGLAALFTGYATASELALAGRLTCDDGTARTADALFAGPAPGMPDMF